MVGGRGPHRGRGSKVNASRVLLAKPSRMNFATPAPASAAVCREHFRLALEGPEAAADVDAVGDVPAPGNFLRVVMRLNRSNFRSMFNPRTH